MKLTDSVHVVLKQAGYQNFSGYLLGHRFEDGRSTMPVPIQHALRLGAAYVCQTDAGEVISPNHITYEDAATVAADPVAASPASQPKEEAPVAEDEVMDFMDVGEEMPEAKTWTSVELEALADAEGIQGLREIGDELGVKERSIKGLIEGIVKAQSGATKLAGDE